MVAMLSVIHRPLFPRPAPFLKQITWDYIENNCNRHSVMVMIRHAVACQTEVGLIFFVHACSPSQAATPVFPFIFVGDPTADYVAALHGTAIDSNASPSPPF